MTARGALRQPTLLSEGMRYLAVTVLGLGVDLTLGYAANLLLGLPLMISAALGFVAGLVVNYVLFERWVFLSGQLSWRRLGKTFLAAQGALLARLACIWLLERLIVSWPYAALLTLVLAAGVSFVINFVLVRLILSRLA